MKFTQSMSAIKFLLLILLCASIFSCASPPDIFVFENLTQYLATDPTNGHIILKPSPACMAAIKEVECGHGVSIVKGREIFVGEKTLFNGKPWSQLKKESVYIPAVESYAPLATYLINTCKKNKCNDDITKYKVKIDSLKYVSDLWKRP